MQRRRLLMDQIRQIGCPPTENARGTRKTMIVALARKLLISLWRLVRDGVVPEGVSYGPHCRELAEATLPVFARPDDARVTDDGSRWRPPESPHGYHAAG